MEKFKITHYQKSGSMWFTNDAKFIITENEYIAKYLFQTVARFEIDKTIASRIPANPINSQYNSGFMAFSVKLCLYNYIDTVFVV